MGLKRRLAMLLDILFPSQNMCIALLSGLCLVRRNGSIASLDLLGWVCFGYYLYYHFGCWRGFAEVFDLIIVFGIVEGWPLWRSH